MGAFATFHKYMGTGLILIWYFAMVIYLFGKEKRKNIRILFLYLPMLVLFFFFNPFFYRLYDYFIDGATYFRMLWLLPVSSTLAFGFIHMLHVQQGRRRLLLAGTGVVLIMVTGTLVYRSPLYSKADNLHHVPWEVVEICDEIRVEGREVVAAFPEEFLLYVRQYSAEICMPYSRENMQEKYDEFFQFMLGQELLVEQLAAFAKEAGCHYVILSKEKKLLGEMTAYDYELLDQVGEYLVYRDNSQDFRNTME